MADLNNFARVRTAEGGVLRLAKADLPIFPFLFGNGCDGSGSAGVGFANIVMSGGVPRLTRDIFCVDLAVPSDLDTHGFKIFCTGTLTIGGTIFHSGKDASYSTRGAGATDGSLNSYWGFASDDGPNGSSGGTGAGASRTAWLDYSAACGFGHAGTSGGRGGLATGAPATGGGTAGTGVTRPEEYGSPFNVVQAVGGWAIAPNVGYPTTWQGGGGGGAGSGSGSGNVGGGGGGAGGVVGIYARRIVNDGSIEAKGGNGGAGSGANAGGGGGGGGGAIILVYRKLGSKVGMTSVAGGSGGAGVGTGRAGTAGTAGTVWDVGL